MTLKDLEQEIRKHVHDRPAGFSLGFNDKLDDPYNYEWLSEEDKEKALNEGSVWSLEIYGHQIEPSLLLAASSLSTQMLARYELQPAT